MSKRPDDDSTGQTGGEEKSRGRRWKQTWPFPFVKHTRATFPPYVTATFEMTPQSVPLMESAQKRQQMSADATVTPNEKLHPFTLTYSSWNRTLAVTNAQHRWGLWRWGALPATSLSDQLGNRQRWAVWLHHVHADMGTLLGLKGRFKAKDWNT